jgi:hypothetical protein
LVIDPSGSVDVPASKLTIKGAFPDCGVTVKVAVGGWLVVGGGVGDGRIIIGDVEVLFVDGKSMIMKLSMTTLTVLETSKSILPPVHPAISNCCTFVPLIENEN